MHHKSHCYHVNTDQFPTCIYVMILWNFTLSISQKSRLSNLLLASLAVNQFENSCHCIAKLQNILSKITRINECTNTIQFRIKFCEWRAFPEKKNNKFIHKIGTTVNFYFECVPLHCAVCCVHGAAMYFVCPKIDQKYVISNAKLVRTENNMRLWFFA